LNYTHLEDLLSDLYALRREEIKLGLEHTIKLLDVCDNPQNHFDAIHIAGTNGKGSTGKMIASIFRQSGYMTGHYTSPHLVKFNERININNRNIPDSYIIDFMAKYQAKISEINATYFEVITAMAFSYFKDAAIEVFKKELASNDDHQSVWVKLFQVFLVDWLVCVIGVLGTGVVFVVIFNLAH